MVLSAGGKRSVGFPHNKSRTASILCAAAVFGGEAESAAKQSILRKGGVTALSGLDTLQRILLYSPFCPFALGAQRNKQQKRILTILVGHSLRRMPEPPSLCQMDLRKTQNRLPLPHPISFRDFISYLLLSLLFFRNSQGLFGIMSL